MPNNTDYVTTGRPKSTGAIFYAPKGTTLPTSADTELDKAFTCVGLISEDGLKRSIKRTTKEIKDWGGNTVKVVQTEVKETFAFAMIEALNAAVQKATYGNASVSGDLGTGLTVKHDSSEPDEFAWVIDQVMSNGDLFRIVIPNGKSTDLGDINFKPDEPIAYGVTITAVADGDGTTSKDYIKAKASA